MCPCTLSALPRAAKKSPYTHGCLIEELDGDADSARHVVWCVESRGARLAIDCRCSLFVGLLKSSERIGRARKRSGCDSKGR
jgi:hypothetical protein